MFIYRGIKLLRTTSRCFSTANYLYVRKSTNPGIDGMLKEMDDVIDKINEDPEAYGDLESDFMDVHKTHKDFIDEKDAYRNFIRMKIVKNKYFKEKNPNFLTFAEKEQIKLLNSRDPEEWTLERLAESFPADEEIILKILKAKWYPYNEKRLQKHDEKVIENWERFNKGEFSDLPPNLSEHLKKFAGRKRNDLKQIQTAWLPKRPVLPKPKTDEFLSIITSCKSYQEKNLLESKENTKLIEGQNDVNVKNNEYTVSTFAPSQTPGETETFVAGPILNKNPITLDALKNKAQLSSNTEKISLGNFLENIVNKSENSNNSIRIAESETISLQKFDFKEITVNDSTGMQKYNLTSIKERIHIPKKLWKKGATYKVEDCYYDYDGKFLFRVPGMTGKISTDNN